MTAKHTRIFMAVAGAEFAVITLLATPPAWGMPLRLVPAALFAILVIALWPTEREPVEPEEFRTAREGAPE